VIFSTNTTALAQFAFLESPRHLGVLPVGGVYDLQPPAHWSRSLTSIRLSLDADADLAPLAALQLLEDVQLEDVRLDGGQRHNLQSVARLPKLQRLALYCSQPATGITARRSRRPQSNQLEPSKDNSLKALKAAQSLRTLCILGASEVDLSPLAGRRHLTVTVTESTVVYGAAELGKDSTLIEAKIDGHAR
jgi:hypothetical protein